eukprot:gene11931-13218_t
MAMPTSPCGGTLPFLTLCGLVNALCGAAALADLPAGSADADEIHRVT